MTRRPIPWVAAGGYLLTIPAANWMLGHVGTQFAPDGPHVLPVGFGLSAPSGVLVIGLALVLRDYVQDTLGRLVVLACVLVGAALSLFLAPPALAIASGVAFGLGELADFAVYSPLRKRHLYLAVLASGAVGAIVDSAVFLWLAFSSLDFLAGNVLGKVWMSLLALPIVWGVKRAVLRDRERSEGALSHA